MKPLLAVIHPRLKAFFNFNVVNKSYEITGFKSCEYDIG